MLSSWTNFLSLNPCLQTLMMLHPLLLSDLTRPGDDLICLEQLNVLTGLLFEEGVESSLEPPFVC